MKLLKVFLLDKRSLLMKSFPFLMMGITKLCTHLQPAQPSSFQPPPNSLQHPQHYLNQNIARNRAISSNSCRKIKSYPFWLKIGTHGIIEVLIPNSDFDFWNSDTKIHFWANLGPKIQSCFFYLKIGVHSISRMQIPNPDLNIWNSDRKKLEVSTLPGSWYTEYLENVIGRIQSKVWNKK